MPNSVEEHDQTGQTDRPCDLGFRRERANGEADEQHGTDSERKSGDADLANQVTQSDCEEGRQYRLASEDLAS